MRYRFSLYLLGAIICLILSSYIIIPQKELSEVERRYLETFERVIHPDTELAEQPDSNYIYYDHITSRFEAALEDQFLFRAKLVTAKNIISTKTNDVLISTNSKIDNFLQINGLKPTQSDSAKLYPGYGYARLEIIPEQSYTAEQIGGYYRLGGSDWVGNISEPALNETSRRSISTLAGQLDAITLKYHLPMYCVLVTTAEDTGWFNNITDPFDCEEYIAQNLSLSCKVTRTQLADLEDYEQCFFKTDHHMNYIGSERMYETIYELMADDLNLSQLRTPIATWNFTELYGVQYRGSRAAALKNIASYATVYDDFIVDEYDLPEHKTFAIDPVSGDQIEIVTERWNAYKAGEISIEPYYDHYIHFYGFDETDTYSDSSYLLYYDYSETNPDALNLLYLGDSYQRAIREVLSSHMKTTVWVDYRLFNNLDLSQIVEQYDIGVILFSSCCSIWFDENNLFSEKN